MAVTIFRHAVSRMNFWRLLRVSRMTIAPDAGYTITCSFWYKQLPDTPVVKPNTYFGSKSSDGAIVGASAIAASCLTRRSLTAKATAVEISKFQACDFSGPISRKNKNLEPGFAASPAKGANPGAARGYCLLLCNHNFFLFKFVFYTKKMRWSLSCTFFRHFSTPHNLTVRSRWIGILRLIRLRYSENSKMNGD